MPRATRRTGPEAAPTFASLLPQVAAVDESQLAAAKQRLDGLTKPLGSLGRLEWLAAQLALIQGTVQPRIGAAAVIVFAGDHGAADAGLSAYPSEVTAQMLENYRAGGAAINVLARELDLQLVVVDAGVRNPASRTARAKRAAGARKNGSWRFVDRSQGEGTQNYLQRPAMTEAQAQVALDAGAQTAIDCIDRGATCIALGEMGIGNTASSALLMHCLTGRALADCVGRGTGLDDAGLRRKRQLLGQAVMRGGRPQDPLTALTQYGGFEIAMLVGAIVAAAARRIPVVVDGFTVSVAAALACAFQPAALDYCIFAHRSAEHGHRLLLEYLGAEPLLDLGLRLGEGSGAALAVVLCRTAAALMSDMASFSSAGVSTEASAAAA